MVASKKIMNTVTVVSVVTTLLIACAPPNNKSALHKGTASGKPAPPANRILSVDKADQVIKKYFPTFVREKEENAKLAKAISGATLESKSGVTKDAEGKSSLDAQIRILFAEQKDGLIGDGSIVSDLEQPLQLKQNSCNQDIVKYEVTALCVVSDCNGIAAHVIQHNVSGKGEAQEVVAETVLIFGKEDGKYVLQYTENKQPDGSTAVNPYEIALKARDENLKDNPNFKVESCDQPAAPSPQASTADPVVPKPDSSVDLKPAPVTPVTDKSDAPAAPAPVAPVAGAPQVPSPDGTPAPVTPVADAPTAPQPPADLARATTERAGAITDAVRADNARKKAVASTSFLARISGISLKASKFDKNSKNVTTATATLEFLMSDASDSVKASGVIPYGKDAKGLINVPTYKDECGKKFKVQARCTTEDCKKIRVLLTELTDGEVKPQVILNFTQKAGDSKEYELLKGDDNKILGDLVVKSAADAKKDLEARLKKTPGDSATLLQCKAPAAGAAPKPGPPAADATASKPGAPAADAAAPKADAPPADATAPKATKTTPKK